MLCQIVDVHVTGSDHAPGRGYTDLGFAEVSLFDLQPLLGILKTDPKDFSFWEMISFATGARGTTTTLPVFCEVIWIAPDLILLQVNFSRSLTLNPVKQQKAHLQPDRRS